MVKEAWRLFKLAVPVVSHYTKRIFNNVTCVMEKLDHIIPLINHVSSLTVAVYIQK